MTETPSLHMQGRMVACEILLRALLQTTAANFDEDPVEILNLIEMRLMSGLQNADRPLSPEVDEIWEVAGASLRNHFSEARRALQQAEEVERARQRKGPDNG